MPYVSAYYGMLHKYNEDRAEWQAAVREKNKKGLIQRLFTSPTVSVADLENKVIADFRNLVDYALYMFTEISNTAQDQTFVRALRDAATNICSDDAHRGRWIDLFTMTYNMQLHTMKPDAKADEYIEKNNTHSDSPPGQPPAPASTASAPASTAIVPFVAARSWKVDDTGTGDAPGPASAPLADPVDPVDPVDSNATTQAMLTALAQEVAELRERVQQNTGTCEQCKHEIAQQCKKCKEQTMQTRQLMTMCEELIRHASYR